jgi:hypothetical protein
MTDLPHNSYIGAVVDALTAADLEAYSERFRS